MVVAFKSVMASVGLLKAEMWNWAEKYQFLNKLQAMVGQMQKITGVSLKYTE